jgi:fatty-acyl-CoA synthase
VPGSKDPGAVYFWRDFEAVKKTGWTIVAFNDKTRRIEATTRSFWFGRISDIVIEARASGLGARTVIRSQSRHDRIDEGANGAKIKLFLAKRSAR